MPDAALDLLLGSVCAVCGRPGRALCRVCRRALPAGPVPARPTPCPPGLARTVAAGEYAGPLRLLVNAHKEQGRLALAEPLGDLLARAVVGVLGPVAEGRQVLLVPVPSRRAVVRRRGHDPLLRVAQRAASRLRREGVRCSVARLLRSTRSVRDQAGLGAVERAGNLAGSMACRSGAAARATVSRPDQVGGVASAPVVVVVDDVVTTGATVREAQRALEQSGVAVSGVAAVAATRRTRKVDQAGRANPQDPRANRVADYPFAPAATSV